MEPTLKADYGKEEITRVIDENGSTETLIQTNRAGVPTFRRRREIRHRTDKTNIEQIMTIVHSLVNDPAKLETGVRFEPVMGDKGCHYIVESYTLLEY